MSPPNLSLVLVMACFWITFWLVSRFLIGPLGRAIEERGKRIEGAQFAFSSKQEEFLSATTRLEAELEEAARQAARLRADLRQQAAKEREALLKKARAEADVRLQAELASLERDANASRAELRDQAQELARLFASRLLGREVRA